MVFPKKKQVVEIVIPKLVKTMENYVVSSLDACVTIITSIDLWMFRFRHDTFMFMINFVNSRWVPHHWTINLFEVMDMTRSTMVAQVKEGWKHGKVCQQGILDFCMESIHKLSFNTLNSWILFILMINKKTLFDLLNNIKILHTLIRI